MSTLLFPPQMNLRSCAAASGPGIISTSPPDGLPVRTALRFQWHKMQELFLVRWSLQRFGAERSSILFLSYLYCGLTGDGPTGHQISLFLSIYLSMVSSFGSVRGGSVSACACGAQIVEGWRFKTQCMAALSFKPPLAWQQPLTAEREAM